MYLKHIIKFKRASAIFICIQLDEHCQSIDLLFVCKILKWVRYLRHHKQNILFPIADRPGFYNLYFTIWSPGGRNAVMLHASFFRCPCTSNKAFVIHVFQITSKNSIIKSRKGLMAATWTKACFCVLLSHVERIVYTCRYVYDVVWRSDGDESPLACVRVPWIRGGRATVSVKLCVCCVKNNLDMCIVMH